MGYLVVMAKDGKRRCLKVGYSWTTCFFGFIALGMRRQWGWMTVCLLLSLPTAGLAQLFIAAFVNAALARTMLTQGWAVEYGYLPREYHPIRLGPERLPLHASAVPTR